MMPLLLHAALSHTSEVRFTSCAGLELGSHGNTRMLLQASQQLVAFSHPFEDALDDDCRSALGDALGLLLKCSAAHFDGLRRAAR